MKDYVIFTDASADMPEGYAEKYDIQVIPGQKQKVKIRSDGFMMHRGTVL